MLRFVSTNDIRHAAAEIARNLPANLRAALRSGALSYHEKDVFGDLGVGEWTSSGAWMMTDLGKEVSRLVSG
jgi:hypothetical protein